MRPIRLAIRPPEYLPRLAYLALLQAADVFVLADTFQYSRQSFQNRTRIRTPQGWHWISVPLHGGQHGQSIAETTIDNRSAWTSRHRRSLVYNYRQTPFYAYYEETIEVFFSREWTHLGELTCASTSLLHRMYSLQCELIQASTLPGAPASIDTIIDAIEADILMVPAEVYDQEVGAYPRVERFDYDEPVYRQHFEGYEKQLSALDLFFNYGPEAASLMRSGGY